MDNFLFPFYHKIKEALTNIGGGRQVIRGIQSMLNWSRHEGCTKGFVGEMVEAGSFMGRSWGLGLKMSSFRYGRHAETALEEDDLCLGL